MLASSSPVVQSPKQLPLQQHRVRQKVHCIGQLPEHIDRGIVLDDCHIFCEGQLALLYAGLTIVPPPRFSSVLLVVRWHFVSQVRKPLWHQRHLLFQSWKAGKGWSIAWHMAVGVRNMCMVTLRQLEWTFHTWIWRLSTSVLKARVDGKLLFSMRRTAEGRGLGRVCFTFSPRCLGTSVFSFSVLLGLGCVFFLFFWLPIVPKSFAQCKNSSHTRESMTDKASCSIGYGAEKKTHQKHLQSRSWKGIFMKSALFPRSFQFWVDTTAAFNSGLVQV